MLVGLPFGHALADRPRSSPVPSLRSIGAVLLLGYAGSRRLVVRHVDVDVAGLDPSFDGLRIAQLSDLHVGPHTPRRFLERVVSCDACARARTSSQSPATSSTTGPKTFSSTPAGSAPSNAPLGVYIIPGNHDVYAGWDEVESALRIAGHRHGARERGQAAPSRIGDDRAGGHRRSGRRPARHVARGAGHRSGLGPRAGRRRR